MERLEIAIPLMVALAIVLIVFYWRSSNGSGNGSGNGNNVGGGLGSGPGNSSCASGCPFGFMCDNTSGSCVSVDCENASDPYCARPEWGGICTTVAGTNPAYCVNSSTSCNRWTTFEPASSKGWRHPPLTEVVGYIGGSLIPVAAQNSDGKWYLGTTPWSSSDPSWGRFVGSTPGSGGGNIMWKPRSISYLTAEVFGNPTCPGKVLSGPTSSKSGPPLLAPDGTPICWNFSSQSSAFTPADGSGCTAWPGMGTFGRVLDNRMM